MIKFEEHDGMIFKMLEEPPKEPDNLYLNIKTSKPADWCFDKKNLLVLVDDNFKGIVGENVTREQVGEIAKLLTEPATQYKVGRWKLVCDSCRDEAIQEFIKKEELKEQEETNGH